MVLSFHNSVSKSVACGPDGSLGLTHATRPFQHHKQVVQVSVAPLIARRIEAAHFRGHAINEKETFVPDPEGTA